MFEGEGGFGDEEVVSGMWADRQAEAISCFEGASNRDLPGGAPACAGSEKEAIEQHHSRRRRAGYVNFALFT